MDADIEELGCGPIGLADPSLISGVHQVFQRAGVEPPARCIETDSVTILKELLRTEEFVGLLLKEIVREEVEAGELTTKHFPEMSRAGLSGVIKREGAVLPPALDALVATVETERDLRRLPRP